jgi:RimJ/RimL family protein N-acetyltransferase
VSFVPDVFEPPRRLVTQDFVLEPLGPEHNEEDYAAWTSSMEHIAATPGFGGNWPRPMTLEENRADLKRHADDFAKGAGFTYTVMEPGDGRIFGCVYIYPHKDGVHDAHVSSWVTADRAALDGPLRELVRAWLRDEWPFVDVDYPG